MAASAALAQAHEADMTSIEGELEKLLGEDKAKRQDLAKRKDQLGHTLAALQRLALRPSAALLVSPGDPNDVIRSGLLMRTAVPQIQSQTEQLRSDLAELAALRAEMAGKREQLQAAGTALDKERGKLAALTQQKRKAFAKTEAQRKSTAERIARLIKEAKSLEELLARLNSSARALPQTKPQVTAPPAPTGEKLIVTPRLPPISKAKGRLTPPANGIVVKKFGVSTNTGGKTRGITVKTRPAAVVVAPWEGKVAFAGVFRSFGRILIIDHGEGYHSLIAGLNRIDAQVDQWVLAGEPVGVAGGENTDKSLKGDSRASIGQAGSAVNQNGGATLYVELRRGGQPINPQPWMAASSDRTRG